MRKTAWEFAIVGIINPHIVLIPPSFETVAKRGISVTCAGTIRVARKHHIRMLLPGKGFFANAYPAMLQSRSTATVDTSE